MSRRLSPEPARARVPGERGTFPAYLNRTELDLIFIRANWDGPLGAEAELRKAASTLDDSKTELTFSEFCEVMGSEGEPQPPDVIARAIFKLVDKDGSGKITHAELRATLLSLGAGLTEEDVVAALELFDSGNDGTITAHEFVQVIEHMKTFE